MNSSSLDQSQQSATSVCATAAAPSSPVSATLSENSTNPSIVNGSGMKRSQFHGPCYLKLLVNNLVAGSVIGKSGAVIASIEQQTGCTLKLSPSNSYFPGTQERVVVMSGQQEQINNALLIILDKIREVAAQYAYDPNISGGQSPAKALCKVVVPKSAVSGIIGKGGQQIKQLQETTGARIQISSREEGLNERTVTISGSFEPLQNAALTVAASIQGDGNMKDHMYVVYNKGGMGGGNSAGALGGMPSSPLASQQQQQQQQQQYNQYGPYGSSGNSYPPSAQYYGGGQQQQQQQMGGGSGVSNDLLNQHCEIIMQIPDACVGPVIGKNGLCLSEIIHTTGARVQVSQKGELIPGTQDRKVVISGGVGAVHNAHIMMLQRLEAAQNQSKLQDQQQQMNGSPGGGGMQSSHTNHMGGGCAMGIHQIPGMVGSHHTNSLQQGMGIGGQQSYMQYNQQMQAGYGY